jgi:ATP-dependent Lon protease
MDNDDFDNDDKKDINTTLSPLDTLLSSFFKNIVNPKDDNIFIKDNIISFIKFDPESRMPIFEINEDLRTNESFDEKPIESSTTSPNSVLPTILPIIKQNIDTYSSMGNIEKLDEWFSEINFDNEEYKKDYTIFSMDNASLNNKIDVLNWWLDKHNKHNISLEYSTKSLENASRVGHIEVLNWWYNSGLELKYSEKAVDLANINGKISSLEWWLSKSQEPDSKIEFKYSPDTFNRCKLAEKEIIEIAQWWKAQNLEIKYGIEFINFMGDLRYTKLHKYLQEQKMIKPTDILRIKPIMPQNKFIDISDMLGKHTLKKKYDTSNLPEEIKKHIEEKESQLDNIINGKTKEYIDSLLKIPFGKFRNEKIFKFIGDYIIKLNQLLEKDFKNESDLIKFFKLEKNQIDNEKMYNLYRDFIKCRVKYLQYVSDTLNSIIYGHENTKKQFKQIISQWLSGGLNKGVVIGVQGAPGVGKTSFIKGALAKCLVDFIEYDLESEIPTVKILETGNIPRPFSFISLGGSANGSTLIGHNITYHDSTHGDIVKCLKQSKIMNPIIFFDELDKISKTEYGYEISSVLTHMTDPVQNEHFTDRYFTEVPLDLSKAIIVFSYNDSSKIDRILLDRIKEINVDAITVDEKVLIAKNFLIPEICKNIGYSVEDINITDEQLKNLIIEYTFEAGVRKLKEKLEEIIRSGHLDRLTKDEITDLRIFDDDYIQSITETHHKVILKKIFLEPKIGCINGMYATSNGLGDIMQIQTKKTYSKEPLVLQTTGSLEKVITESMNVAKTVAWNLLKPVERNAVINTFMNSGIHIHCPDGSTSKDGPSAGGAITCAIYSLFTNKPIRNDISMTGEIDLDGNITAIGGLDAKLTGAKRAGVKIAYVPLENKRDIELLKKKIPDLFDDNFNVKYFENIKTIINEIFL